MTHNLEVRRLPNWVGCSGEGRVRSGPQDDLVLGDGRVRSRLKGRRIVGCQIEPTCRQVSEQNGKIEPLTNPYDRSHRPRLGYLADHP